MEHLIVGIRNAVARECWYPALTAALALPDTCAAIDQPGPGNNRARYVQWAQTYFCSHVTAAGRTFFTADELYRLRCSFIHAGDLVVSRDQPQAANDAEAMFEVLNEVTLFVSEMGVVPARGLSASDEGRKTNYTVAVDELCEWLCQAAEDWLRVARADSTAATRIARVGQIMRLHPDGRRTPI